MSNRQDEVFSVKRNVRPPQWPLKVLRVFLKKDYVEEIEGDMEEIFYDHADQHSLLRARWIYTAETFMLLRPVLIRNLEMFRRLNQLGMFRNYFKVSLRGLMKTPLNSFINVFGLAMAIGIAVFAFAFARWTYSTDQFHKNKDEVFMITAFANRDGSEQQYGATPRPLGEMLQEDFASIRKICRVEDRNVVVKVDDHVFHERVRYTDPEFLDMFTFPLKWGTAQSLKDVNSIVMSEAMSEKYFGDQNSIGQTMLIKFANESSKVFKVTGVAQAFPDARTIDFDFLINFENFRVTQPDYDFHDWKAAVDATLIQIDPKDIATLSQKMEKYRDLQRKAVSDDWAITRFSFVPLAALHRESEYIHADISASAEGNYSSVIYLGVVASLMLLLACFNYINIALATAAKRLKEIGVRKSIGASRWVVIVQFLAENMVVTFFALIIGFILGLTVVIPWFENLWSFSLEFNMVDPTLFVYLAIVMFVTGLISGIYPALYISHFHVVSILKGTMKFGQRNPITKTLLSVQLFLTFIFITASVMFTQNSDYLARRPWGYNQNETMYARVADGQEYDRLAAEMARDKNVVSMAGATHHLGRANTTAVIHLPGNDYEVDVYAVDPAYFETLQIELKEGRGFNRAEGSDRQAVVINELLAKNMGWDKSIGQTFEMDSVSHEVIGVVKEFHSYSFFKLEKPAIFKVANRADFRFLALRTMPGKELETYATMQAQWARLFPETPFQGGYQEDVWGNYYTQLEIHGHVWRVFATVAVILACLGLYGLVTLNITGRVKEFSIRKVLGAGSASIAANVARQYLLLIVVALAVGAPVSHTLVALLFDSAYKYHMPVTYASVLVAMAILVAVLAITFLTQVRKVIQTNPVQGLKTE